MRKDFSRKYLDFSKKLVYNGDKLKKGGIVSMKSVKISLEMAQKVKEFVAVAQDCPYEILLKSGKYVVDAKSILGIFSLDLSQPLTVEVYSDDCAEFLNKLEKFRV